MNPTQLTPALILHTRPYRDTSLLAEIFTADHGRLSVVARGVRRAKSRVTGLLQSFVPLLVSWAGRGELYNLRAIEADGLAYNLQGENLVSGLYLNELLVRLLPRHDPHPQLFQAYIAALQRLHGVGRTERSDVRHERAPNSCRTSQAQSDLQITLRTFEKTLLQELGYGIAFDQEAKTGVAILAHCYYQFDPEVGFIAVEPADVANDQLLFQGQQLLRIHQDELQSQESLQSAKRLMRLALKLLLGDRPLLSRRLFVR